MNFLQIGAILLGFFVIGAGLKLSADDPKMFIDGTSLFIVFGGTFAATCISVQIPSLFGLMKIFITKIIKGSVVTYSGVIKEILVVSNAFYKKQDTEAVIANVNDTFLKECLELYEEDLVDSERFITIITDRRRNMHKKFMLSVNKFKNIGKYPPAFGMMGTTIGMIVLLGGLGGKDAMKTMGPAMAVCLITTLYGVILANAFFVPVSENIEDSANEINLKNEIIVHGLFLVLSQTPPAVIAEELNSYLDSTDRLDWKEVLQNV